MTGFANITEQNPDGSYSPKGGVANQPGLKGTPTEILLTQILIEQKIHSMYLAQMTAYIMNMNFAQPVLPYVDDPSILRTDPTILSS